MILEQIVSVPKAAEMLGGISPWTVYSWLSRGVLPRVKIGARTMVRVADLQRLIAAGVQGSFGGDEDDEVIRESELAKVIEDGEKSSAPRHKQGKREACPDAD